MASGSTRLAAGVAVFLLLCLLPSFEVEGKKIHKWTVYVQENRDPGPNATLITVLTASGNLSDIGFGTIQAFSNVLTDGASNKSAVIGVEPGLVIIGTQNIYISYVFTFNTPTHNGTLSVQGQFALNVWPRELAVVGGTGDFRFVNGYDVSEIVDDTNLSNYITVHRIYLKYV